MRKTCLPPNPPIPIFQRPDILQIKSYHRLFGGRLPWLKSGAPTPQESVTQELRQTATERSALRGAFDSLTARVRQALGDAEEQVWPPSIGSVPKKEYSTNPRGACRTEFMLRSKLIAAVTLCQFEWVGPQ